MGLYIGASLISMFEAVDTIFIAMAAKRKLKNKIKVLYYLKILI